MLIGNNMTGAITLPTVFSHLVISPVRNESETPDQTDMMVCAADEAEIWGIYGVHPNGMSEALHDEADPEKAGTALLTFAKQWNLSIGYASIDHITSAGTPADMADRLAEIIHDEIPGYDDPEDFRDDDFENHPLAPLREVFVETYAA